MNASKELHHGIVESMVHVVRSHDMGSWSKGLVNGCTGSIARRKSRCIFSLFHGCQDLFQGMSVGIVGTRIKHPSFIAMFKRGTQGDGLHHSAVTLVSPIAEVNGQGFKFHRYKLEKSGKGGKPTYKKSPAISQGF